jgi:lipid-A-disaccharide synthase
MGALVSAVGMRQGRARIMLVAGEASGEVHGANLLKCLMERNPALEIFGIGGEHLRRAGLRIVYDLAKVTGMGFSELFGNLKELWAAYRLSRRLLVELEPRLLILIDFPEFNLRLAKFAKRQGVPVLYYISPQVWAWRKYRVRQVAARVDAMAVVFPFEVDLYEPLGVKVQFVGHPLLDIAKPTRDRETTLSELGLDADKLTVAIMPGSRRKEVSFLLETMLAAGQLLQKEMEVQFVLIRAGTIDPAQIDGALTGLPLKIRVVGGSPYDVLNASDLVWVASGTATLETGLLQKPMIILYRLTPLSYWLGRLLVRVDHIGMVNIMAGERVVPELIQDDVTPERILRESKRIIESPGVYEEIVRALARVRARLGTPGAPARVAEMALGLMAPRSVEPTS